MYLQCSDALFDGKWIENHRMRQTVCCLELCCLLEIIECISVPLPSQLLSYSLSFFVHIATRVLCQNWPAINDSYWLLQYLHVFNALSNFTTFNFTALSKKIFQKLLKIQLKLINETIYKVGIFYNAAGLPQSVFKCPKTDWNRNKTKQSNG